jgi:hypothetical protein
VVRKRSAEEWAKLLALFERSRLSQKRFCRENEVALSTLQYWRRESGRGRREGALVEVPANVADTESVGNGAPLAMVLYSSRGNRQRTSGKRRKSRSAVWTTARWESASRTDWITFRQAC